MSRPLAVLVATLVLNAAAAASGRGVQGVPPPPPGGLMPVAQDPSSSRSQQPAPTGVILGQVVDAATGRPIPSATVALIGRSPVALPAGAMSPGAAASAPAPAALQNTRALTNGD